MLLNRHEIREDKFFPMLTEAILRRDQPQTADLFFRMVAREGRSVADALGVVAAAEAPFERGPCSAATCSNTSPTQISWPAIASSS